jgi:hypothetical protein
MTTLRGSRFVYLSHTAARAHAENYFSILCLMHRSGLSKDVDVVVYTDDTDFYRDLPVEVRPITDSLRERASNGYRNKLKSLVMADAADDGVEAIIYCDGDTWMRRHPARLAGMVTPRDSVMHIPEVRLDKTSDANKTRLRQLLEQSDVWVDRGQGQRVSPRSWMFNSGVVGLHAENFGLLQKAVDIGDQIHRLDASLFAVEQFSLGQALRTRTRIRFADSEVFHFWSRDVRAPFSVTIENDVERLREADLEQRAASAYALRPRYQGRAWLKMRVKKSAWAMGIVTPSVRSSL